MSEDIRTRGPRWPAWIGMPLSTFGLGIAIYLTYEHYTGSTSLSCPATGGIVNCLKVTTSSYSMIHGIPVAVLGLVFFVVMLGLQTPWAWSSRRREVRWGRVLWSLTGVGTAVWLIYAELFRIGNICLWCTSVHIISLIIFVLTAIATTMTSEYYDYDDEETEDDEEAEAGPAGPLAESHEPARLR